MKKAEIISRKNQLIERMGVYLENEDNMAPLEARIFSTLILTGKKGITFEQLVTDLCASKSTICTHLNTLQVSGRANYYTKTGDRKRYFTVAPNRLIQVMDEMLQKWNSQYDIHKEALEYKELVNTLEETSLEHEFDLEFHQDYLQFLEEVSASVQKLKNKIIQKEIQNENK
ncbi:transcriptional regulator [Gillisia sp. M10.2A]|uniref:Transcriptional regulator n=1 Tax=Gillisia lutea TaxID=2909668 RepID=A0ABS9ECD9_9FLAO|nr:transcriptional regulator [Gillisia lutea]MCF4100540.1 transcriptional regulator [Gillisia lutea]